MAALARRLMVGVLIAGGALAIDVEPVSACSLAVTPVSVNGTPVVADADPIAVRAGDRLHLQGTGFYDFVPESELPSTTTTTRPDGAVLPECPATRPAAAVVVTFLQPPREAREIASVEGNAIDQDVVIPTDAVAGPAHLGVGSGPTVNLTVLASAPPTTQPRELPRTGATTWPTIGAGTVLLLGGLSFVGAARHRRLQPR